MFLYCTYLAANILNAWKVSPLKFVQYANFYPFFFSIKLHNLLKASKDGCCCLPPKRPWVFSCVVFPLLGFGHLQFIPVIFTTFTLWLTRFLNFGSLIVSNYNNSNWNLRIFYTEIGHFVVEEDYCMSKKYFAICRVDLLCRTFWIDTQYI